MAFHRKVVLHGIPHHAVLIRIDSANHNYVYQLHCTSHVYRCACNMGPETHNKCAGRTPLPGDARTSSAPGMRPEVRPEMPDSEVRPEIQCARRCARKCLLVGCARNAPGSAQDAPGMHDIVEVHPV